MKQWEFTPDFNIITVNYVNFVIGNLKYQGYSKKISQEQMAQFLKATFYKDAFKIAPSKYSKLFGQIFGESILDYENCFPLKKAFFYPNQKSYQEIAYKLFGAISNIDDAVKIVKKSFELRNGKDYPDYKDFELAAFVHPEIKLNKIKNVA